MPDPKTPDVPFVEQADYEKGFSTYFETEVKPALKPLEDERLQALSAMWVRDWVAGAAILCGIAIVIFIFSLIASGDPHVGLLMRMPLLVLACVLAILTWAKAPGKKFESDSKKVLLPKVVEFLGLAYRESSAVTPDVVALSNIVPVGDHGLFESMDEVYGTYQGEKIGVCELVTSEHEGKTIRTLFDGLLVAAELDKPFQGQTVVVSKQEYIAHEDRIVPSGDLHPVVLESNEFNAQFTVYSTDQIEARYLLTPDIMERLMRLSEINDNAPVRCSFVNQVLFIAIASPRDFFVPSSVEVSMYDTKDIHDYLAQLHHIFSLVDILKLNQQQMARQAA